MGSRSWLFLTAKGFPLPFSRRIVFPNPRTLQTRMFTFCGCRTLRQGRGLPSGRRVTQMNKIHAARPGFVVSRAGDANARKPAQTAGL
jgi:hypothetical protein